MQTVSDLISILKKFPPETTCCLSREDPEELILSDPDTDIILGIIRHVYSKAIEENFFFVLHESPSLAKLMGTKKTEKEILTGQISKAYDRVFPPNGINSAILKRETIEAFLEELESYYET